AIGRELGMRVFIKRDDCTGLGLGGNKSRKLEFTLGDALQKGADTIITSGGLQSNHVRHTAAAAAKLGLECHAVLNNPLPDADSAYRTSGNYLLDTWFGATLYEVAGDTSARIAKLEVDLAGRGRKPYVVPLGASHGIGALGYVECARELLAQCGSNGIEPSHVFVTTGSAGTHGGLLAGLRLFGSPMHVIGVSISETPAIKRTKVRGIVDQVMTVLARGDSPVRGDPVTDDDIVVFGDYMGDGYGVPTKAGDAAMRRLARREGLLLDPVYTSKAMAGMLDLLENKRLGEVRDPIFLHTGGTPALFAYP
ncbi:MAG: D-cysteine desulfhydrase family protein, partial [Planctomycetota bacterium]